MSNSVLFISMLASYPACASPPLEQTFTCLTSAPARTGRSHLPPACALQYAARDVLLLQWWSQTQSRSWTAGRRGNGAAEKPAGIRFNSGDPRVAVTQGPCPFHHTQHSPLRIYCLIHTTNQSSFTPRQEPFLS